MKVFYKNREYLVQESCILCDSDVYQYGWEFLRDGVLAVGDLKRCICDQVDDTIADEIVKHIAERYANDEDFRKTMYDNVYGDGLTPLSIQMEDDEEKPAMEATSKTTEDTHGGDEATKSVEGSPSSADDGNKENNNPSEADENIKDEMSSEREEVDGRELDAGITHRGIQHNVADIISAIEEQPFDDNGAVEKALDHVVRHIRGRAEGGIAKGWDGRKIVKHLLSKQLNRIPNDHKRTGRVEEVIVAVDCSGSCWTYLDIINKSLQKLSKTHRVVIMDVSNGFNLNKDSCVHDDDPYENRRRLEEAFCDGSRIVMHKTVTTPCVETAAKLAEKAEAMIIIADYDGYLSIAKSVQLIRNHSKYPWFIDLETRYGDPSEHNWSYDGDTGRYLSEDDWPEAAKDKWLRLFPRDEY